MDTLVRATSGPENAEGSLMPYREPLRTWAGHGSGAICNGCGVAIQAQEIEYEIEMPAGSDVPTLHFHFACYRRWTGRGNR